MDHIDLYLLHGPYPCKADGKGDLLQDENGKPIPDLTPIIDTWRVLERFYKEGKIRAIGVSNFNQQQLKDLYHQAEIKPHNLQVECHILWPQDELFELCKNINITMTAYAPTGLCETLECSDSTPESQHIEHSLVLQLAKKYDKRVEVALNKMESMIKYATEKCSPYYEQYLVDKVNATSKLASQGLEMIEQKYPKVVKMTPEELRAYYEQTYLKKIMDMMMATTNYGLDKTKSIMQKKDEMVMEAKEKLVKSGMLDYYYAAPFTWMNLPTQKANITKAKSKSHGVNKFYLPIALMILILFIAACILPTLLPMLQEQHPYIFGETSATFYDKYMNFNSI